MLHCVMFHNNLEFSSKILRRDAAWENYQQIGNRTCQWKMCMEKNRNECIHQNIELICAMKNAFINNKNTFCNSKNAFFLMNSGIKFEIRECVLIHAINLRKLFRYIEKRIYISSNCVLRCSQIYCSFFHCFAARN